MLAYDNIKTRPHLLKVFELLITRQTFFLCHATVNGNSREILFDQQLCQSHTALNRLDENDHLRQHLVSKRK